MSDGSIVIGGSDSGDLCSCEACTMGGIFARGPRQPDCRESAAFQKKIAGMMGPAGRGLLTRAALERYYQQHDPQTHALLREIKLAPAATARQVAQQASVTDVTFEIVGLTIDIAKREIGKALTLERVIAALKNPAVQKAIQTQLQKHVLQLLHRQVKTGRTIDRKTALSSLKSFGKASGKVVTDDVLSQIKGDSQVALLKQKLKDLGHLIEKTPFGVWVDENRTAVYIVGAVVAIGGLAGLYFSKSGDDVGRGAVELSKLAKLSWRPVGSLKIEGALTDFKPSEGKVGARVSVTKTWDSLTLQMKTSGVISEKGQGGRAEVIARLSQSRLALSAKAWASLGIGKSSPDFGLEVGVQKTVGGIQLKFDAFAERKSDKDAMGFRTSVRGESGRFFVEGSAEFRYSPGSGDMESKGLFNVGFSF